MPFGSLWWVVILAALAIWMASAVIWMVLPHHRNDFDELEDEDAVRKAVGSDIAPGQYRFPFCATPESMKSEETQAKMAEGPIGVLTTFPKGPPNMGKMLGLWFGYTLLTSFVVAYLARMTMSPGEDCYAVFRFTSTVAFAMYALPPIQESIWMGRPWKVCFKSMADGIAYALIVGSIFCWGWPDAAAAG